MQVDRVCDAVDVNDIPCIIKSHDTVEAHSCVDNSEIHL